jgi:hypothetical protein
VNAVATIAKTASQPIDQATLQAVRPTVRSVLMGTPAFRKLRPDEQQEIANNMVKVAAYMANPDGLLTHHDTHAAVAPPAVARAQAEDPVEATKARLSRAPGQVGKDFRAGGVREGVDQFGALVQKVDFPVFVGGLIKNVFQAIVDSSIQQMHAYGDLLSNVAKTVDEFARDNISENNSRDWLAGKYPDVFDVQVGSTSGELAEGADDAQQPTPALTTKSDNPQADLAKVSQDLNMAKPVTDISDAAEENRLVTAARLEMARSRQQLLASMVILGINRIVVTDGHIQAKVIFDMRASDVAARRATASMYDARKETATSRMNASYGGWYSPIDASVSAENTSEHVATVGSAVDDTSESKAEVKAKLSGEVRVNFKSDYFPMEKMASPQMIAAIQGRSIPPDKPAPATSG